MVTKIWSLIKNKFSVKKNVPSLIGALESAKQEWLYARKLSKTVTDPELIDYASYLIKANEAMYTYLLRQAKQKNLRHTPYKLNDFE